MRSPFWHRLDRAADAINPILTVLAVGLVILVILLGLSKLPTAQFAPLPHEDPKPKYAAPPHDSYNAW